MKSKHRITQIDQTIVTHHIQHLLISKFHEGLCVSKKEHICMKLKWEARPWQGSSAHLKTFPFLHTKLFIKLIGTQLQESVLTNYPRLNLEMGIVYGVEMHSHVTLILINAISVKCTSFLSLTSFIGCI